MLQTQKLRFLSKSIPELYNTISIVELHNSNHIEGNTLTYNDTLALLNGELAQVEKSKEKEVQEVLGYRDASEIMIEMLREWYVSPYPLTVDHICEIHYYLMKDVNIDYAGRLRQHPDDIVRISGALMRPIEGGSVIAFLDELITWYNTSEDLPILEKIAILKTDFIYCHPFFDGNGRVSRLIMNMELMKHNFYPNIIRVENKEIYCKSLEDSILTRDYDYFINFFYSHYLAELQNYECAKFIT